MVGPALDRGQTPREMVMQREIIFWTYTAVVLIGIAAPFVAAIMRAISHG